MTLRDPYRSLSLYPIPAVNAWESPPTGLRWTFRVVLHLESLPLSRNEALSEPSHGSIKRAYCFRETRIGRTVITLHRPEQVGT